MDKINFDEFLIFCSGTPAKCNNNENWNPKASLRHVRNGQCAIIQTDINQASTFFI